MKPVIKILAIVGSLACASVLIAAIGSDKNINTYSGGAARTVPGSAQSDWEIANSETKTTQSAAELLYPGSIDDSSVTPLVVPSGVTRFMWRVRTPIAVTTLTTDPVIRFYGIDSSGVAMRLDNTDVSAAGLSISHSGQTPSSAFMNDGTYYYTDIHDLDGIDIRGCRKIIAAVETASVYTDGATSQTCVVQIKLLN